MQQSGYWGAVRVVPSIETGTELIVDTRILQSDSEALKLEVTVNDSRGVHWFTEEYEGVVDAAVYRKAEFKKTEPFQFVYNEIANDIAFHRNKIQARELKSIREVAELRFAGDFAPDAFGGHVERSDKPPEGAAGSSDNKPDFLANLDQPVKRPIGSTNASASSPARPTSTVSTSTERVAKGVRHHSRHLRTRQGGVRGVCCGNPHRCD